MIKVNEQPAPFTAGMRIRDLATAIKPLADLFIVNGFPVEPATLLQDNDSCWLIKKGELVSAAEMDQLLYARHTPGVHARVKNARIGIMGLGGLGSVVACSLARIGVGSLLLADFDLVEPSNLNRQQYFIDQVGLKKTLALRENLARINPHVALECLDVRLTEMNIPVHFQGVDVLVECFDDPAMKAAALRTVLTHMKSTAYVGSSGLAGYGDNNTIRTRKLFNKVYLVGDGESAAGPGQGLMAPRVGIAAQHQANQVLRILLGCE